MRVRGLVWGALAVILGVAGNGCGSSKKTVRVDGTVTWDGAPVAGATVTFVPTGEGGKEAIGLTDNSGNFELTTFNSNDGAMPGEYAIIVTKKPPVAVGAGGAQGGPPADPMAAMKEFSKGAKVGVSGGPKNELPAVYEKAGSPNPLKAKVESGMGKVELKLTGAKPK